MKLRNIWNTTKRLKQKYAERIFLVWVRFFLFWNFYHLTNYVRQGIQQNSMRSHHWIFSSLAAAKSTEILFTWTGLKTGLFCSGIVKFEVLIQAEVTGRVEVEPSSSAWPRSPSKTSSASNGKTSETEESSTNAMPGKILYELNGEIQLPSEDKSLITFIYRNLHNKGSFYFLLFMPRNWKVCWQGRLLIRLLYIEVLHFFTGK